MRGRCSAATSYSTTCGTSNFRGTPALSPSTCAGCAPRSRPIPGLRGRAFLSSVLAGAVALLNVIIVGQLMFVSTEHDLNLLLTLVIFSAVITAFFSFSVAATVARRIENIAAAIRLLAHGAFATRLAPNGNDEVARLSEDVDLLAAR